MSQSIEQLLDAREREVRRSIDDLRARLVPLEVELEKITAAREAMGGIEAELPLENGPLDDSHYKRMTYEELAAQALASDHFEFGATISELLDFIRTEYGREIAQGSFSPILSRMAKKGLLTKAGKAWFWKPGDTPKGTGKEYDL
jgi:hypothetical protein